MITIIIIMYDMMYDMMHDMTRHMTSSVPDVRDPVATSWFVSGLNTNSGTVGKVIGPNIVADELRPDCRNFSYLCLSDLMEFSEKSGKVRYRLKPQWKTRGSCDDVSLIHTVSL